MKLDSTIILTGNGGFYSTNGLNWETGNLPNSMGTDYFYKNVATMHSLTRANDQFVTVGDSGNVYISLDGITWTGRTSRTTNALRGTAHSDSIAVAVGDNGTILTSSNGLTWGAVASGTSFSLNNEILFSVDSG